MNVSTLNGRHFDFKWRVEVKRGGRGGTGLRVMRKVANFGLVYGDNKELINLQFVKRKLVR